MITLFKLGIEAGIFAVTLVGGAYLGVLAQQNYPTKVAAVLAFLGKKSS
jgi:hypothetical protein